MRLGKVKGYEISKNRDGDQTVLNLQVEISSDEDVQTVQFISQSGEDTNPAADSDVIIIPVTESFKVAVASFDGITPSMEQGEKKIYSISSGAISAFINLLASGIIELNGNNDFAVRYTALNTALQSMLTSLNADIVAAGGSGTTTLDISGAKVDEVKII